MEALCTPKPLPTGSWALSECPTWPAAVFMLQHSIPATYVVRGSCTKKITIRRHRRTIQQTARTLFLTLVYLFPRLPSPHGPCWRGSPSPKSTVCQRQFQGRVSDAVPVRSLARMGLQPGRSCAHRHRGSLLAAGNVPPWPSPREPNTP